MAEFDSLRAAVAANNLLKVEEILGDLDQQFKDQPKRNEYLNQRKALCFEALKSKNLPLLNLAFHGEIFIMSREFDRDTNIEMVNAAIAGDFAEGLQFLHERRLSLEYEEKNWSALQEATSKNKTAVIKVMLSLPYININLNPDETLLMTTCSSRHVETLNLLLSNNRIKETINVTSSKDGGTALHRCFEGGCQPDDASVLACVKALVQAGADVNIPAKSTNKTPYALANEKGQKQAAQYLKDNGAK
ncbi:hypothetical protein SNE40_013469 [Patella caerulea]|uniref:Uncharacterized protein n=1 Tax=Patella caerulea TaxID=87958 RepID=A0AAN8JJF9_PATCE